MGHARSPSRSSTTRATARRRRPPAGRCAGSTRTRAGSGCSSAGRRCTAPRASRPATACSSRSRSGRSSASGPAFEAGCQMGLHCVPGGGMSSQLRLAMIERVGATVVCCTPTYALRLAEVAAHERAGAPARGEQRARADRRRRAGRQHSGDARADRAELGRARHRPSRPDRSRPGQLRVLGGAGFLHLNEGEYICEVLDPVTARPVRRRRAGRAGRHQPRPHRQPGHPLPHRRHRRRGDRNRARAAGRGRGSRAASCARADDMVNIRGVNVYPASIESVVRAFPEVVEFRSTVSRPGAMRSLSVEIELAPRTADRPAARRRGWRSELREALGLTVPVHVVEPGTLAAVRDEGPAVRRGGVDHVSSVHRGSIRDRTSSSSAAARPARPSPRCSRSRACRVAALRARALSALSHRRVADPRDLLGAEAAEHAAEDAAEPLRQEVQRAVRQRRTASCRRRSTSGTTSRTSARRPGRSCAASSTR